MERRLAALLIADVVDSARHMGRDELGAVQALAQIEALCREGVEGAGGRVLEFAGDTLLAEFGSTVDAVGCAIKLQAAARDAKQLPMRMAVHVADMIVDGGRVRGLGLVVAFQVSLLSERGGLCLSADALNQIQGRLDLDYRDLGEREMRGLAAPLRVYRVTTGCEEPRASDPGAGARHRLLAILHGDAVSFSHHMAMQEGWTIESVQLAREVARNQTREHRGRLVDTTGDGILASFPSVLDAVRCALAIQQELGAGRADADAPLRYRLGIHLGDVREEGGRLYGTPINVAARLQAMCEPGQICISAAVYDQVQFKLDLAAEDLGDQELKNIPVPIRAHLLRVPEG